MAHSVKWLTSGEAATARYKRLTDGQAYPMITHQYVVTLAKQWVTVHNATSVGIRKVERDGSLGSPDIYDWSDFMEEAIDVVKQWRKKQ